MGMDEFYEDALANMAEAAQLRASSATPRKGKGSGGGWTQRFSAPSGDEDPAQIVLVPGEYEMVLQHPKGLKGKPFKITRRYGIVHRHYNSTKRKYCRCTAGLRRDRTGPQYFILPGHSECPSCYHIDNGAAWLQVKKLHVFSTVLLDHFHLVDSDRTNNEGKPFQDYEECLGKSCKLCKKGVKRVFGKRMYWPLGPMHARQLGDIAKKQLSRNCVCGGKIRPIAFACPACQATLRDLEDEPFDTKKELAQFRAQQHDCGTCNYKGPMVEVPHCDSCKKAQPLGLFNTKLEVYMAGSGTQSSLQVPDFEPLSVELKAKIKDAMIPFDLEKVWDYKPLSPEDQSKLMGLDNPFSEYDDDDSGSSGWGDDDGEDVDDIEDDELDIEV